MQAQPAILPKAKSSPKKVLLVEDNRVSRLVAERLLRRWGYCVCSAVNGLEALKLTALEAFDLILMNLSMPVINGRDTASLIRRLGMHYQMIPIVGFSANRIFLQGGHEPFTDFLEVPYMPERLKNLLEQHLEGTVTAEASRKKLQHRIAVISGQDETYHRQLVALFAKSCQELLADLESGRLDNASFLGQVRHKHRSSFRLLELYSLEAALDSLQEALDHTLLDASLVVKRKQTVAMHTAAVMDELKLLSA